MELQKELMRIRKDPLFYYHHQYKSGTRHWSETQTTFKRKRTWERSKSRIGDLDWKREKILQTLGHDMYIIRVAFSGGYRGGIFSAISVKFEDDCIKRRR